MDDKISGKTSDGERILVHKQLLPDFIRRVRFVWDVRVRKRCARVCVRVYICACAYVCVCRERVSASITECCCICVNLKMMPMRHTCVEHEARIFECARVSVCVYLCA